jgi:hypothetical protein
MRTKTMQTVIIASLRKQAGRPHTDVDPTADGKIFLTGTFDLDALVADIEMWALGGKIGIEDIKRIIRNAGELNPST